MSDLIDDDDRVRIIKDGRIGVAAMAYYDYYHTGNSPDLVRVTLDDGKQVYLLSDKLVKVDANTPPSQPNVNCELR